MADQSLTNPHFFQPLLPGFHTHLNIPVSFFSKHVEGRNEQNKTAKLRSDASDKTWLVKIDGLKLTDGWEDFAFAHDLRTGDIVVFRHEGEMVFHVTVLGPSCCEVQYTSSHNISDHHNDQTNIGECSRKKRVKKNPIKDVKSSADQSSFVANVTNGDLENNRLYLPQRFARSNGLDKMNGESIVLVDEEGRKWESNLKNHKAGMQTYVRPGWTSFCVENNMRQGQRFTFKLVQKSRPLVMRLCLAEHRPISETSLHHSYFVGSVTASNINNNKLYLHKSFVSSNGLNKGCTKIVLQNELGREWSLALKHYKSHTTITHGWASFCQDNGLKDGDSFKFKLVWTKKKPILSLCPADSNSKKTPLECAEGSDDEKSLSSNPSSEDESSKSNESEDESSKSNESEDQSSEDKNISQYCSEVNNRNYRSNSRASPSYSQKRFLILTLTPFSFRSYKMFLPRRFTKMNGIYKLEKITLLDQDGLKWEIDLYEEKSGRRRLGKGWRQFCKAHGVKVNESFVLELIWDKDGSPMLKFCNKVNSA